MMIRPVRGKRRRAATAVETAFVLLPATMFLFGVFEYGRLLMDWNLLNNAAREGCRFALANNTDATLATDVTTTVTNFMAGESNSFTNFTVTVSGTHAGTAYTGNNCNNLTAGDTIVVKVSGQYKFLNILTTFSQFVHSIPTMPALTMTSSCTMICEGAT